MHTNTSLFHPVFLSSRTLWITLLLPLCLWLGGCNTQLTRADAPPEWTRPGFQPEAGIIRSSPMHIQGRDRTREILFDQCLVELSKSIFGTEIALNSRVIRSTQAYNDEVGTRIQQVDHAEITSADERAQVRASVKAEWFDPRVQRLYLWVVPGE